MELLSYGNLPLVSISTSSTVEIVFSPPPLMLLRQAKNEAKKNISTVLIKFSFILTYISRQS